MSFFLIFTTLLFLIYFYTGRRLIPSLVSGKAAAAVIWFFILISFLCLPLHFYLRFHDLHPSWAPALAWIGYTGLGFSFLLFCLVLLRDLLLLAHWIHGKIKLRGTASKQLDPDFMARRRKTLIRLTGIGVGVIGAGASAAGFFQALRPPKVVQVKIPVSKAHQGLKGLRILQITDLHVGPIIGADFVKTVCRLISQEKADIIVITGDLADGSPAALKEAIAPLAKLDAPLGKYFVTGNHEYYSGVDRWVSAVARLGFYPLLNTHRVIQRQDTLLTLAGVTDAKGGRFSPQHRSDPRKAFQDCPENSYKLLLAHQPVSVYEAAPAGADLILSGHTHGGQIFPFNYFIYLEHPFVKGMYQYRNTRLYVSQGTGYWGPPMRLGTFPEITVFTFI